MLLLPHLMPVWAFVGGCAQGASLVVALALIALRDFKNPQAVLEYRIVPLMMSVVTIGNDLSAAALTRGLGNGKKRTSICRIGFQWKDFALMIMVTAALLVFLLF